MNGKFISLRIDFSHDTHVSQCLNASRILKILKRALASKKVFFVLHTDKIVEFEIAYGLKVEIK